MLGVNIEFLVMWYVECGIVESDDISNFDSFFLLDLLV